ncbi:hypothetical protein N8J89_31170 [Crossiella sp. CA-258035]|uniref:hypothetical protein n=1 Tax=Crossiella sp. CA-258035 TaxID=2981138 RepID=UPI0024BBEFF8|nr:hypothetical protein [Crossiella sp. CA-258035]WHT17557.1 hypothetical protein N8J89_31170 [Crossiella sp. CA-258035]
MSQWEESDQEESGPERRARKWRMKAPPAGIVYWVLKVVLTVADLAAAVLNLSRDHR